MKCPLCGSTLRPGQDRCPDCGSRCRTGSHTVPQTEYTSRPRRRGWCLGVLIGVAIVTALIVGGLSLLWNLVAYVGPVPEPAIPESVAPDDFFDDKDPGFFAEPETIPVAEDGLFTNGVQGLWFLPENWTGGPLLRIPETVDGRTVTEIGKGCFRNCSDLTTIILPDTVTSIGADAFSGCGNLRGLFLPEGTLTIGADAFSGCSSLEAIYIPDSVKSIAPGCFDDCAGLLYIFYDGTFDEWDALYSDYVNPFTTALCTDGSYYHGVPD